MLPASLTIGVSVVVVPAFAPIGCTRSTRCAPGALTCFDERRHAHDRHVCADGVSGIGSTVRAQPEGITQQQAERSRHRAGCSPAARTGDQTRSATGCPTQMETPASVHMGPRNRAGAWVEGQSQNSSKFDAEGPLTVRSRDPSLSLRKIARMTSDCIAGRRGPPGAVDPFDPGESKGRRIRPLSFQRATYATLSTFSLPRRGRCVIRCTG